MADTLLAHLIPRVVTKREPVATQALAYVLNAAPDIAKAFVSVVHQTGFAPFELGRIAAEERHSDGIPELTVRDTAGAVRVVVENKFWAGLTATQPVGYLDQLPSDVPAVLLFVVPHARLYSVWAELKERCATRKINLTDGAKTDDITWSRSGNRILAITSWKHLLTQLQQAASAGGHDEIEQDIIQLRGLTDQENTAEFLPLREDEITSAPLARRLLNYANLIFDTLTVAQQFAAGGVARQAEGIAKAIRDGHEQGAHFTSDQFKAGLAEVRTEYASLDTRLLTEIAGVRTEVANLDTRLSTQIAGVHSEIANLETRLIRWMVVTVIATAALTVGILRLIG